MTTEHVQGSAGLDTGQNAHEVISDFRFSNRKQVITEICNRRTAIYNLKSFVLVNLRGSD